MIRKLLLLLLILTIGCQQKNNTPITLSLNDNWQFKGVDTLDWKSATVPGNVFTDLLDHKIIEDPFVKNNEEKVQWVSKKNWKYKTKFILDNEILKKKNIELNFNGLDTYATIFLNDFLIGQTENAFKKYTFKVEDLIKKENELKIIFTNTNFHESLKEEKNPYKLPEGKRIYTRKAQFQHGWDWGPKLNTSGIWKNVTLNAWNDLKFENIHIKQLSVNTKNANLLIDLKKFSNVQLDKKLTYNVYVN